MLRFKNMLIFICFVVFLVVGIKLYFNDQSHKEFLQLKEDFKRDDKITVLEQLMASEKYATDIRKAGYIIQPDGAIRLDGGINPLEIEGDLHLKIAYPGGNEVIVFFETEFDGTIINCQYILNDNLNIVRSYYSQINKQNINEQVSISQSEEARLLKIVQDEIDGFVKKMYQTLYG
ncbi:thiol-disulfide isomerase [Streptococcus sanguinis]|uniref:Thiol-disulfide isomerase n=1 Tax=Streptococcus sanguinis TaxID=1305 RepID=A0A0B7GLI3_STRSA|nr:thiol-disulfide isomerase [Streptococcus sanguinis]CEL90541.1 conserved protein of unknown function [Streptococcus sanguinis]